MLSETLESLMNIRGALLRNNSAELEQAVSRQQETVESAQGMRRIRQNLRGRIASVLSLPPGRVSIDDVIDTAPGDLRVGLQGCRDRLRGLAHQIEQTNQGNAALIAHSMDMLHQLLACLTGAPADDHRYGKSGQISLLNSQSIFQSEI